MGSNSYYIIQRPMEDSELEWYDESSVCYVAGQPSYLEWVMDPLDARRFKSITEIRRYITNVLKFNPLSVINLKAWEFHLITMIPPTDIFTGAHTMGLLKL